MWLWRQRRLCVSARCCSRNSSSSFPPCKSSPPTRVCSFYCVLHDCWTQSLPHNMAHQACFHKPLGQEWRWRAGLCLGALHPSSSCSLPFIYFVPPCLHSNLLPLFPSIIHVPLTPPQCPLRLNHLFHPLPISCFVCKPQGREMGEKHSLCTTVTKDRWVIAIYVPGSLLPQKTHVYMGGGGEPTLKLPLTCCAFTATSVQAHTLTCTLHND